MGQSLPPPPPQPSSQPPLSPPQVGFGSSLQVPSPQPKKGRGRRFWVGAGVVGVLAVAGIASLGNRPTLDPSTAGGLAPTPTPQEQTQPTDTPADSTDGVQRTDEATADPTDDATAEPTAKPTATPKPTPRLTAEQENAVGSAHDYLAYTSFSRSGLIKQLMFEGYSKAVATFAVDHIKVNWNEQAYLSAKAYLAYTHFSRRGLIDQLKFEGFTTKQATYGVTKAGL